jgi:hypothetical protein
MMTGPIQDAPRFADADADADADAQVTVPSKDSL